MGRELNSRVGEVICQQSDWRHDREYSRRVPTKPNRQTGKQKNLTCVQLGCQGYRLNVANETLFFCPTSSQRPVYAMIDEFAAITLRIPPVRQHCIGRGPAALCIRRLRHSDWSMLRVSDKLLRLSNFPVKGKASVMKLLLGCLVLSLLIAHQDYWQWLDASLVFGFLPYSLVYHIGVTLAAAAVWLFATTICWPGELDHVRSIEDQREGDE